ncbi:ChaN family lipoprotein [Adhaeretor mobilis]|uniref:Haem-binding uptake Tiki superfamily ChaN domain-containing protein n=1 Tax=Adhaeretor mobilis TaxID=1930276 RepID=A0A517MXP7_9BACT|nr:ChaN family lipoprotein [Adhaeretor mobilis]QDS99639.1 hypothetical protein HG15A2_29660 [Adhaeretor mobilis]
MRWLVAKSSLTLFALITCSGLQARTAFAESPRWAAPPIEQAISIRDGHSEKRLSLDEFLVELSKADVVFLGESHTDETTHRFQLAVYQGLLDLKQKKVVLALEMFERDVQGQLNEYLSSEIDEATFLADARPWINYHEAYRPLIEQAKATGTPAIASNFPQPIRRRLAMESTPSMASLSDKEKKQTPKQYFPNSNEYWRRTDNATRGHQGMMPASSEEERLYSTQSLWDNAMGEACADALDKYPDHCVLHINGGFHSAYRDGTVHQLLKRKPSANIKTVSIVPALNPATSRMQGRSVADYVVYVEARASNIHSGERSVQIGRELKYRFHQPTEIEEGAEVPLLIWLTEDGLTAKEGMAFCKQRFGSSAAIAVVEAPFRAIGEDYAPGGRWYWPDTFAEDTSTLVSGVERIGAYLLRHFPIDADHICVAGEGAGATVATVIAVHSDRMKLSVVAINPRQYSKVKDLPLPLPEFFGDSPPPKRSLLIIADPAQQPWWENELVQYNAVEIPCHFQVASNDPWQCELQELNGVRDALGLATETATVSDSTKYILVESDSARARHWGRLQAYSLSKQGESAVIAASSIPDSTNASKVSVKISSTAVMSDGIIPKCPGPFGGTTILVLPEEISAGDIEKWSEVEANDPLTASSRFHRVRIATTTGEFAVSNVLEKLRDQNRKNILIVPAVFFADLPWLRTLKESTKEFEDQMTLHWMPGLGGRPNLLGR